MRKRKEKLIRSWVITTWNMVAVGVVQFRGLIWENAITCYNSSKTVTRGSESYNLG
jgi:hypothetical protein